MKNIANRVGLLIIGSLLISISLAFAQSTGSQSPSCVPNNLFFSVCTTITNAGQSINQVEFNLGLEQYPAYLSNQQNYLTEQKMEVAAAGAEVQNGSLTPAAFNSTVISAAANVNVTLRTINATATGSSQVITNTSLVGMTNQVLVQTNQSFNQQAVQIDAQVAPIVNPSAAAAIQNAASSSTDDPTVPDIVPIVSDPPPGKLSVTVPFVKPNNVPPPSMPKPAPVQALPAIQSGGHTTATVTGTGVTPTFKSFFGWH